LDEGDQRAINDANDSEPGDPGPAGKQILVQDPSGNVVELFEWAQ